MAFCISLSRVQLIIHDQTLGWVWNVSCLCLFDRGLLSLRLFQTLQFLRTCYIFLRQQYSVSLCSNNNNNKKKTHSSQQFLMWNPWHVLHLHQLFLYVMNWTWAFLHFSKCPCSSMCAPYFNHVSDHLPTFWWMPPPAMERFRSENSSDDKGQRRSTRWPTPAHFLFKSASTAGSCKLFPVRRGLPVVLCWL